MSAGMIATHLLGLTFGLALIYAAARLAKRPPERAPLPPRSKSLAELSRSRAEEELARQLEEFDRLLAEASKDVCYHPGIPMSEDKMLRICAECGGAVWR